MTVPAGITCHCGATATKENDITSETGHTFGRVWTCDDHVIEDGVEFEVPGTDSPFGPAPSTLVNPKEG